MFSYKRQINSFIFIFIINIIIIIIINTLIVAYDKIFSISKDNIYTIYSLWYIYPMTIVLKDNIFDGNKH